MLNDDDTFEIHAMSLNDIDQNLLMMAAFMGKVYESAGVEDTWDGYDLDQYYVTDTLLDGLTQEEVRILLNALYAHYGYTFTTEKYAQFFSSKPWYSSRGTSMSDCESRFNDYERKNKETITAYETRKGWR